MQQFDWKALHSGTDIRGVAMDGAPSPKNLTEEVAAAAAKAFAARLREGQPDAVLTVAVGRDSRLSGPALAAAVIEALAQSGCNVIDCGLASTPAMFMTTVDLGCDAAIQITASHHPWYRNGLKFFLPQGGLQSADVADILRRAEAGGFADAPMRGTVRQVAYMQQYAAGLRRLIIERCGDEKPLQGLHIVVDAGNGAGGFYVRDVLAPLGAETAGSQFLEPDGRFPNHIPNPEDKAAMQSLCDAVRESGADFGIIFDTDVDRAGCADADGSEINRNRLIALASLLVLQDHPGCTVVTDSVTSLGLGRFIAEKGGKHCRFKRGYRNVINEAQRRCALGADCPLAIETSGHAALRDNYFLDDGAYLMTRLLILLVGLRREGKTLAQLLDSLQQPAEECEVRLDLTGADFRADGLRILQTLEQKAEAMGLRVATDSAEGVRLCSEDGFVMLRVSVHDPVMPVNAESDTVGGCKELLARIIPVLDAQNGIDTAPLHAFVQR